MVFRRSIILVIAAVVFYANGAKLRERDGASLRASVQADLALTLDVPEVRGNPKVRELAATEEVKDASLIISEAMDNAFRGGFAGIAAGIFQVLAFMWLRTAMNHRYFCGGTLRGALSNLWEEGGIPRFYKGLGWAIVQNPLSRFGDTFANTGIMALFGAFAPTVPTMVTTVVVATAGATWRIFLTPVDTFKTTMQVQGEKAMEILWNRVGVNGVFELWSGASANFLANWVGMYPWWATFNLIQATWLEPTDPMMRVVRNGVSGMAASIVSDCISNSLRVIKTVRQATPDSSQGYVECVRSIIKQDGLAGLFGRGLATRVLTNVLQGTFFSIVWRLLM